MNARPGIRRIAIAAGLVFVWCALWGEVSVANVASGVVVSIVVTSLGIGTRGRGAIRVVPLLQFGAMVAVDLVVSTLSVAREVLRRSDRTEEAIIGVSVPAETRSHLLLMVVAITVTPGTAVVDADPDTGTLYLHLLHYDRAAAVISHVEKLSALACRALPTGRHGQEVTP